MLRSMDDEFRDMVGIRLYTVTYAILHYVTAQYDKIYMLLKDLESALYGRKQSKSC